MLPVTRRALLVALLAVSCTLAPAGSAAAISGLASTGPAVGAQYPDAEAQLPDQRRDVLAPRPATTLAALGAGTVGPPGADRGTTALADEPAGLVARAVGVLAGSAGGGARHPATLPVLLAGLAVLACAGAGAARSRGGRSADAPRPG